MVEPTGRRAEAEFGSQRLEAESECGEFHSPGSSCLSGNRYRKKYAFKPPTAAIYNLHPFTQKGPRQYFGHMNNCILTKTQELQETCEKLLMTHFKAEELTFIQKYVQVMAPLAKALDILQSDKMAYTGVLVPTISILLNKG
ncbi:hypothetical protein QQF64_023906 [Cirrhinus molitorella]|uniref:Uncharacterized protein n=1 Tax=Cirrhinus molitorella TaxID=172907 RepID=A0ABR3NJR4_9TELE